MGGGVGLPGLGTSLSELDLPAGVAHHIDDTVMPDGAVSRNGCRVAP